MTRKFRLAQLALALSLTALSPSPSQALFGVGDIVFDPTNLAQNITSAIEAVAQTAKQAQQYITQLDQYILQIKQYEDMVKNTIAPAAYVWDQANQTMNELRSLTNVVDVYKGKYGNLENYLSKFQDVSYYRSSPCYSAAKGCSAAEREALQQKMAVATTALKQSTDAMFKGIDKQNQQIDADSRNLERLQSQAQGAQGRMEALQAANQLASNQAAQLLQIRALLLQQQQLLATQAQALNDRQSQEQAAHEASTRSIGPDTLPANPMRWRIQ